MARQDTVAGFQNYSVPLSLYTTAEGVLYAPLVSAPGFQSPLLPLSTATYPVAAFITPSPDIAGSVYDGHPFEIKLAIKFTTTGSTNILLNMYQVTNAVLTSGITSATYAGLVQAYGREWSRLPSSDKLYDANYRLSNRARKGDHKKSSKCRDSNSKAHQQTSKTPPRQ